MPEKSNFEFFIPTKVLFGAGMIDQVGKSVALYGKKVLMVTTPWIDAQKPIFEKIISLVQSEGVNLILFDKACPNPTVGIINEGVAIAREEGIDVMLGVGGGSSIDTAKAIAVGVTHPGTVWDYLYFRESQPTAETLPIIAVTTTSGTGSHVTKVSVFTNEEIECKSAICNPNIFPKIGIVDPELMYSMPSRLTASTGFDAFTHAFESYININSNIFVDAIAVEAIKTIIQYLPSSVTGQNNEEAKRMLAYADTLAGITIANVGTTLPHAMGQPISGHFPKVSHGEALAVVYPAFAKITYPSSIKKFATISRLFNPDLSGKTDDIAAGEFCNELKKFLKNIGMYLSLEMLGVTDDKLDVIILDCMDFPDMYVNPMVPSKDQLIEMFETIRSV